MKKKEQFSIALWDRLQKDNIPHSFETRSGIKIEHVTHFDFNIKQPIIGYDTNDNSIEQWGFKGSFEIDGSESELDLFIVWEEEQLMLEGWLNIYDAGYTIGYAYKDKISADEVAGKSRIACVKVSIPYTKGEGLNNPTTN